MNSAATSGAGMDLVVGMKIATDDHENRVVVVARRKIRYPVEGHTAQKHSSGSEKCSDRVVEG